MIGIRIIKRLRIIKIFIKKIVCFSASSFNTMGMFIRLTIIKRNFVHNSRKSLNFCCFLISFRRLCIRIHIFYSLYQFIVMIPIPKVIILRHKLRKICWINKSISWSTHCTKINIFSRYTILSRS